MFSFVLAMSAAFLAAPAIASDVETGTVHAMLARPTPALGAGGRPLARAGDPRRRATRSCRGCWRSVSSAWSAATCRRRPLVAVAFLAFQAVAVMTLALALGTRLPAIAAGRHHRRRVRAGLVRRRPGQHRRRLRRGAARRRSATWSRILIPTDGLWRGVIYGLEPPLVLLSSRPRATRRPCAPTRSSPRSRRRPRSWRGRSPGSCWCSWPASRCSAAASSEAGHARAAASVGRVRRGIGSASCRTCCCAAAPRSLACRRCRPPGTCPPRRPSCPAEPYSTTWYSRPDTPRRRRSSLVMVPTLVRLSFANIAESLVRVRLLVAPAVVGRRGVVRHRRPEIGPRCRAGRRPLTCRASRSSSRRRTRCSPWRRRRSRRRTP